MGLANFFDKAAFSASQILQGFDALEFKKILASHRIQIRTTKETIQKPEAKILLDLLVRLLARLYPKIGFECIDDPNHSFITTLIKLSKSINPNIETDENEFATIHIDIGNGNFPSSVQQFFLGSDQWIGSLSLKKVQSCGNSLNPFGPAAAACLGAANVFRFVFKENLPFSALDENIAFSTFDYSINDDVKQGPDIGEIKLSDTVLVGLGAIGNGIVWALRYVGVSGSLALVDNETVELSNLQRYILATQNDLEKNKVDVAEAFLKKSKLTLNCYASTWKEYIRARNEWKIHRIVAGVDSAETRIEIQTSLPLTILNAWTQMEQIGISRHYDFLNDACLACLYLPGRQQKSLSEDIAENLNMSAMERDVIRPYLADKKPIDQNLLELICTANNIAMPEVSSYIGKPLEIFHSELVCGGILMRLTGTTSNKQMLHVPSAFESVLAGVLLAAELIVDAGKLRKEKIPNITKMNLMRPLTKYTTETTGKHPSGRCICQDPIVRSVFRRKW